MKLSKHFSREEFECGCGCGFAAVDVELLDILEKVRSKFNAPVTITSACRCAEHNSAIGGSYGSKHKKGIAADIAQFTEERDYPYKQVQYQQSLLQGLPISTQDYQYAEPSTLSNVMSGAGGILGLLDTMGIFNKKDED